MNNRIFSYKSLSSESIQIDWWLYNSRIPGDGTIKKWKKNDDIPVTVFLSFDNKAILDCVAPNTKLAFYFYWHSLRKMEGTSLHGVSLKWVYSPENTDSAQDLEREFIIPGKEIAGALELCFAIAIEDCPTRNKGIYATENGSIIYETSRTVLLEGNQALFPVKAIDFNQLDGIAPDSLYFLKKKFSQMDSNFNSAYVLYFNTKHKLFKEINSDSEQNAGVQYVIKMIMYDVYKTIACDALDPDTGLTELFYDEKELYTLRAVYSRIIGELIRKRFPDFSLDNLKSLYSESNDSKNRIFTAMQEFIFEGTL